MSLHRKDNKTNHMENKSTAAFFGIAAAMGTFIGMWAVAALASGFAAANWQISEMCRQFLVATGNIQEYEAFVSNYSSLSGVDYLLAGVCFAAFTAIYKYLNSEDEVSVAN